MLLHCETGETANIRASLFKHGQMEDIQFDIMDEETLWAEFVHSRVQCNLEVICPEDEKSVKASMQNLRKYVSVLVPPPQLLLLNFIWFVGCIRQNWLQNHQHSNLFNGSC